jgi:hypothetical protein
LSQTMTRSAFSQRFGFDDDESRFDNWDPSQMFMDNPNDGAILSNDDFQAVMTNQKLAMTNYWDFVQSQMDKTMKMGEYMGHLVH